MSQEEQEYQEERGLEFRKKVIPKTCIKSGYWTRRIWHSAAPGLRAIATLPEIFYPIPNREMVSSI